MNQTAAEPFVSGPHLVHEVHPGLVGALSSLWIDVTRAGGAVLFRVDTSEDEIRAAAEREIEEVRARRRQLIMIGADHSLAGTVVLCRGARTNVAHRAEVFLLMVRPDLQGRGWGTVLLDAAVAHARAVGLEQLLLSARGGTPLPRFYAARGWSEVGVWPGALRVAPDDDRDEHWFQLRLS